MSARGLPTWDLGSPGASRAAIACVSAALTGCGAWALFGAGAPRGSYVADCAELQRAVLGDGARGVASGEGPTATPENPTYGTLTLWADLFPTPPPEPPPPPPPTLELELVAVIDGPKGRSAFLYDRASQRYFELGEGDAALSIAGVPGAPAPAPGARLVAIGKRHAEFELAGQRIRLELAP